MCWSLLVCECMCVRVYWCVSALEFIGVCVSCGLLVCECLCVFCSFLFCECVC